ncbi:hypothetical protein [Streptomyces erythrochromogenes]|uniref:hypothetical protein n=1 Tax=Streptomyces erythrochromogenes TaxID=285574 RepID=UPI003813E983
MATDNSARRANAAAYAPGLLDGAKTARNGYDGQDDLNADEVWGGPNGSESLTDARRQYAEYAAGARSEDRQSVAHGGDGAWWSAARQLLPGTGEPADK